MKEYVFFRKSGFYTLQLNNDTDAIANAKCNPGTLRVENILGGVIWELEMKDILESPKVFEAYARIDYCYLMIKEINKSIQKPISGIDALIDKACKYNPIKENIDTIITLLQEIISSKKIINADYSKDEDFMNQLLIMENAN